MLICFIPGNVPSSKNNKQWTGKYLIHSKTTKNYIAETTFYYQQYRQVFLDAIADLEKPFSVGLLFVRGSRHRFDYINACQIVADLMVKHDWLEDDNADILNPYFLPYRFDKENPGVEIYV